MPATMPSSLRFPNDDVQIEGNVTEVVVLASVQIIVARHDSLTDQSNTSTTDVTVSCRAMKNWEPTIGDEEDNIAITANALS